MTKTRNPEASRLEADYLARVRSALTGRDPSEIDEVVESLEEHIEEDLSSAPGESVSLVQMANVVERLGPPESYGAGEPEAAAARAPVQGPRVSRLAVAGALGVPAAVVTYLLVATLACALCSPARTDNIVGAGTVVAFAVALAGFVTSLFARGAIRRSGGMLQGERLAQTGIWLPVAFVAVPATAAFIWYATAIPSRDRVPEKEMERIRQSQAESQCRNLWQACHGVLVCDRPEAETIKELLIENTLEPDWAADARAGRTADNDKTVLSMRTSSYFAKSEFLSTELDVDAGTGFIIASFEDITLRVPVVRWDGRWYLARKSFVLG